VSDPVVMPPASCCICAFCVRRRHELQLASRIERELHGMHALTETRPYLTGQEADWLRAERVLAEWAA
jgi:hypothetical protein